MFCILLGLVHSFCLAPQGYGDETVGVGTSHWEFDVVTLRDGRKFEGILTAEPAGKILFLQIARPKGRPMYGVQHQWETGQVAQLQRLSPAKREALSQQFANYRQRALIEAGRMEDVTLKTVESGGGRYWQYEGPWFVLQSTANEDVTRRCIVRVEQVFAAYRQILPPRVQEQKRTLKILYFGSTEQYKSFLRAAELPIENPAFYAADWNAVVAGSDVDRLEAQIAAAKAKHDQLRENLTALEDSLPERIRQQSVLLRGRGASSNDIRRQISLSKRRFQVEIRDAERELDRYDRKNENIFDEATAQMFATLYHEAFHAYLENFVFPINDHEIPRWLNEGLAQVFETGLLEAGMFRVDAPHADILNALKSDLRSDAGPLSLAQVLTADHRNFLVAHGGGNADASNRHYAYSWGLAYYLAFEQRVLGTEALEQFVKPGGISSPIRRFEKLVGQPLADFEPRWQKYMLALTSK